MPNVKEVFKEGKNRKEISDMLKIGLSSINRAIVRGKKEDSE